MLDKRPTCENCNKSLPPNSTEAMICGFECTFCNTCVNEILHNVCPNCGGGFEHRPVMPKRYLEKYPPSDKVVHKPVDMTVFQPLLEKNREIDPSRR